MTIPQFDLAVILFNEVTHPACVGCCAKLAERGLLVVGGWHRHPHGGPAAHRICVGLYELAPGVTLDDCRRSVLKEHHQTGGMSILDYWGAQNEESPTPSILDGLDQLRKLYGGDEQ